MSTLEQDLETGDAFSILEHLNELRVRLTWVAVGLIVATVISFIFAEQLLLFLLQPYGGELQTLRPTEGIETYFKVAFTAGAILSMPVTLHQIWLFIAPGLTRQEKKYVYIFLPAALSLFTLGILFAWFVLVPAAVSFLSGFLPDIFVTDWTGQEYISFILVMLFWLGVSFEMPVISYFIARVGIWRAETLKGQWRFAIVGVAVLAAAITPSIDPVTMLLTMAPLLILYFVSIGTAYIGQRQFERAMAV